MSAENHVELNFLARLHDRVSVPFRTLSGNLSRGAQSSGRMLAVLGGSVNQLGGKMGRMASAFGGMFSAFAAIGPVGAVIMGISKAIEIVGDRFKAAADKVQEFAERRLAAVGEALANLKAHMFDATDAALEKARADEEIGRSPD